MASLAASSALIFFRCFCFGEAMGDTVLVVVVLDVECSCVRGDVVASTEFEVALCNCVCDCVCGCVGDHQDDNHVLAAVTFSFKREGVGRGRGRARNMDFSLRARSSSCMRFASRVFHSVGLIASTRNACARV